jgi:hypothetical protein
MGQYFAAVNTDKHEFVCPWCLSGGAKLWEWAANTTGSIFTLLLRKSTGSGGGDYYGYAAASGDSNSQSPEETALAIAKLAAMEGKAIKPSPEDVPGRWAGDRIALVGDYDESGLFDKLYTDSQYRNISREVAETWNSFMELPDRKLRYERCSTCAARR